MGMCIVCEDKPVMTIDTPIGAVTIGVKKHADPARRTLVFTSRLMNFTADITTKMLGKFLANARLECEP